MLSFLLMVTKLQGLMVFLFSSSTLTGRLFKKMCSMG